MNTKLFLLIGVVACTSPTEPIPKSPITSSTPTTVTPPTPTLPAALDTSTFAIPDTVLLSALIRMGLPITNGRMLTREALGVTQLTIGRGPGYRPPEGGLWTGTNGHYISDLTGLEKFTNLRTLRIEHQKITSIPLHAFPNLQLVSLWGNPITALDVSRNTSLVTLGLSETGLTEIDVSNLSALFEVNFQNDADRPLPYTLPNGTIVRGFSKLDFSKNPGLTRIYIWNNGLTSENLILSNDAKNVLTDFWAYKNKFTHLSFLDYKELSTIVLYDNQLETLDLRRVGQAVSYYVPSGLYTTGNPRLLQIRVTNPGMTIHQRSLGAPIYIDPWTQFIP